MESKERSSTPARSERLIWKPKNKEIIAPAVEGSNFARRKARTYMFLPPKQRNFDEMSPKDSPVTSCPQKKPTVRPVSQGHLEPLDLDRNGSSSRGVRGVRGSSPENGRT